MTSKRLRDPSGVTVRPVEPDEVDESFVASVSDLVLRSKASWGYDEGFMARFSATMVTQELVGARRVSFVAEEDGVLLGLAVLDDRTDLAWLEDMWVDPSRFGSGVGRRLWSAVLEQSRAWGHDVIELESDPNAEGFYVAMGAHRVGTKPSTISEGRWVPLMRYGDSEHPHSSLSR